jgi:hypothetical protein
MAYRGTLHRGLADRCAVVTGVPFRCEQGRDDVDRKAAAIAPASQGSTYVNVPCQEPYADVAGRGASEHERNDGQHCEGGGQAIDHRSITRQGPDEVPPSAPTASRPARSPGTSPRRCHTWTTQV